MRAPIQNPFVLLWLLAMPCTASADAIGYTNETDFISALESQMYVRVFESFEDADAWGTVRSTIVDGNLTADSITNFSVTFSSNTNSSDITTSSGAAYSGNWGAYSLPHGSYATGIDCNTPGMCGDGLRITSAQPMYAMAFMARGFYGSKLEVYLDNDHLNPVEFPERCDIDGENCINYNLLTTSSKFFGLIDPAGFTDCQLRELEGKAEDQKFIWCDDFTIGFTNPPPPKIRSMIITGSVAQLHLKELATPATYHIERSFDLRSNDWVMMSQFTAGSTESNRTETFSNEWNKVYLRLRSP
ncbi:MAG: hypothetical protein KJ626_02500 [Verrucomicrobia bacterium]|nr:hypothetical protein [Verrucomicrobiota bacterium]